MPRIAPDSADVVVWRLNEGLSGPPFLNTSTSPNSMGSAMDLTTQTGTIVKDDVSVFLPDTCLRFPAFGSYPSGASATFNRLQTVTGTGVRVPAPLTVSGWVRVRSWANLGNNFGCIMRKNYRSDETWAAPFETLGFFVNNSANGVVRFEVTTAATNRQVFSNFRDRPIIQASGWSHIGLTFDRQLLIGYINGIEAGRLVLSTPQDLDFGTDGSWAFGAVQTGAGNKEEGAVNVWDWRIARTIRGLGYFERVYRAGVLSW